MTLKRKIFNNTGRSWARCLIKMYDKNVQKPYRDFIEMDNFQQGYITISPINCNINFWCYNFSILACPKRRSSCVLQPWPFSIFLLLVVSLPSYLHITSQSLSIVEDIVRRRTRAPINKAWWQRYRRNARERARERES